MEKSEIINALHERIDELEKWRKSASDKKKTSKEDEEVCPECGGDLLFVEDNIVVCKKCKRYFEINEEEEK